MVTDMEEEMLKAIEDKGVDVCREPDLESFRKATETLYQDSAVTALGFTGTYRRSKSSCGTVRSRTW